MKKTVTFGIAVYNVEMYLERCIKSVLAQDGDDIEIIIVDDGSTDSSGFICDKFSKEKRVSVVHKENGGVSTARNMIIERAQGKWISFIDGDDMLSPDAAETIRKYAQSDYDVIYFDAVFFRYDKSIPDYAVNKPPLVIENYEDLEMLSLATLYSDKTTPKYTNKTVVTIWGKLYNTEFLRNNGILFDKRLRKSQDVAFNLVCVSKMKSCIMIRNAIYLHRKNEFSIVRRYNPKIKEYNSILANVFLEIVNTYPQGTREKLIKRYYMMCLIIIRTTLQLDFCHKNNKKSYEERHSDFRNFLKQDWCIEAAKKCELSNLNKSDVLMYNSIVNDDFKLMCKYFKKNEWDIFIKKISAILRLNKLKSKLRKIKN